jgi:LemA protein
MDVYLKKRWDLVPNLVSCVKAYATHEKDIFEHVAILRSSNYSTMSQKEKLNTNEQINNLLPQIIAIAENYPEIKANESFSKLMENLTSIEEDIANSRKYYNGTVRIFNNFLEIFPFNVIGKLFGFKTAEMFTISNDERNNIKVEF